MGVVIIGKGRVIMVDRVAFQQMNTLNMTCNKTENIMQKTNTKFVASSAVYNLYRKRLWVAAHDLGTMLQQLYIKTYTAEPFRNATE